MAVLSEKIYEQAINLPIDDRLDLIDRLLVSTNLPLREDIDKAWTDEVERRCKEIDQGKARLIDGDAVFKKVKDRFIK